MRSKSSPPLQSLYITVDKRRDKESESQNLKKKNMTYSVTKK